jgi:hypothetical protein
LTASHETIACRSGGTLQDVGNVRKLVIARHNARWLCQKAYPTTLYSTVKATTRERVQCFSPLCLGPKFTLKTSLGVCPSTFMERRRSFGAVSYPGNPRFRTSYAFKMAHTSAEMDDRCRLLTSRTIVITEEGAKSVRSREEVKDIF